MWSTVGGGDSNQALGQQSTVGGGQGCGAIGASSTVGGGNGNVAGGNSSTVSGGDINQASGFWSTVVGGSSNQAGGEYSLAAGRRATVRDSFQSGDSDGDEGTFVWADSANVTFQSTGPNQFLIRAAGGVGINTNAPTAALEIGGTAGVDGIRFPDGTLQTTASSGGNTLDQAYDQGGAGAGRTIAADSGAVNIAGPNGLTVNGDVGIGNTAPSEKLDVSGNIFASGTLQSGNLITIDGTAGAERVASANDLELHVGAGRALRLEANATSPNIVGGFNSNNVDSGVFGASIGGGGAAGLPNRVTDEYGTVSGGRGNQAGDAAGTTSDFPFATVGGGRDNLAIGRTSTIAGGRQNTASHSWATVGGGFQNTASGAWDTVGGGESNTASGGQSTVGGGTRNSATGPRSTVSGGVLNQAVGYSSMVPGGEQNLAGGDYSFAAGRQARIRDATQAGNATGDQGTFVWADSTFADFISDGQNRFLVRASGGTRFYSNSGLTVGVSLAAGGGSWASISDRSVKQNIEPVEPRAVLERLAAIPIATWNYKAQDPAIRHMGPMAQDFHAAFNLGQDEKYIGTLDADGVALAAIQGLRDMIRERDCQVEELRADKDAQIHTLRNAIKTLRAQSSAEIAGLKTQQIDLMEKACQMDGIALELADTQARLRVLEKLMTNLSRDAEGGAR